MNTVPGSLRRLVTGLAGTAMLLGLGSGIGGIASAQPNTKKIRNLTRSVAVSGRVTVKVKAVSGNITITAVKTKKITAVLKNTDAGSLKIKQQGRTVKVKTDHWRRSEGDYEITVPLGTDVEVKAVSGDITINGRIGRLEATTVSGDLYSKTGTEVEVRSVSGDITLVTASGDVSVTTVSGDTRITSSGGSATQLSFRTTSGDLNWKGTCGKGCKMALATLSGSLKLAVSKKSSFVLKFKSFSGDLKDHISMKPISSNKNTRGGGRVRAQYGSGAGKISVATFSGNAKLRHK